MNCLRCPKLKVGGELRDEVYCTQGGGRVKIYLDTLDQGCPHGVSDMPRPRWSKAEKLWLAFNYQRRGLSACAHTLDRGHCATAHMAQTYRLTRPRRKFTAQEDAEIRDALMTAAPGERWATVQAVAQRLGRPSAAAVLKRGYRLGILRTRSAWSPRERAYLSRYYRYGTGRQIAAALGRSLHAVHACAQRHLSEQH